MDLAKEKAMRTVRWLMVVGVWLGVVALGTGWALGWLRGHPVLGLVPCLALVGCSVCLLVAQFKANGAGEERS